MPEFSEQTSCDTINKYSRDPNFIPLMPVRDLVIFPQNVYPLFVGRKATIDIIENAYASHSKQIFLITQKSATIENPAIDELYSVGTVGRILQKLPLPDGTIKILCEGLYRAKPAEIMDSGSFFLAMPESLAETESKTEEEEILIKSVHETLASLAPETLNLSEENIFSISAIRKPGQLADAITRHLKCDFKKKQEILEILDVNERLEQVYGLLMAQQEFSNIEKRIKNRVKMQMEHNQKEYYLTEQIKAINKEMGRDDNVQEEIDELEQKIKQRSLPAEVEEKALKEIHKMRGMTPMVAEYSVSRGYIEWILDLPWNTEPDHASYKEIDINKARLILDKEHYGLSRAKERILEFLAVQKLSRNLRGPILCFVGPPGVGKTSLAKSVAAATGREFARLSLGGVRDEAEIRGHRRTYVGALPGKIIQSLRRVKNSNPLFCLDEIDKIAQDYRGDPASALLEVLDPGQNATFLDHYLDLEYDLSKIFFITTANTLQTIPAPLVDRMEIIELSSYLEIEKKEIAKSYILPKQLVAHGLKPDNLKISDAAIEDVIQRYTREAGVRGLEREIGTLCRKTAIKIVESEDLKKRVLINKQNLHNFLGIPRYRHEEREKEPQIGVCAGLAWNVSGGDILFVETSVMSGSGQVVTTGQLGEVMIESAKAAVSYVRSRSDALGLDPEFYKKIDLHVHVPAGATPKDGPSAGITLATSITSALLGIPVRNEIAMTGEISLRGRVLPIGGLREKLLAARRGGMKSVILPKENKKDLEDVPDEAIKGLELIFVDHVDEVLPYALAADYKEIFKNGVQKSKKGKEERVINEDKFLNSLRKK